MGKNRKSGAAPRCRADEIIDSSTEDVAARVGEITGGEGAHSGLDPVAGTSTGTVTSASGSPHPLALLLPPFLAPEAYAHAHSHAHTHRHVLQS